MPDITGVVDSTSLFAGVIGLLFSSWITDIEKAATEPVPRHYADRRKYLGLVSAAFFTKALPLTLILASYLYANLGISTSIIRHSHFYNAFSDGGTIKIEWSVFILVYAAMAYFMAISAVATIRLILAWKKARKGRTAAEPRIHIFG